LDAGCVITSERSWFSVSEELMMIAPAGPHARLGARCPLCGASLLSLGGDGRVEAESLTLVPVYTAAESGEAYGICDQCAYLASLPTDLPLN
jgi:hypothetical protein